MNEDSVETRTAVEVPPRALARQRTPTTTASSSMYALATLRDEEAETARSMIVVGRWVGIAVLLPLPFVGGDLGLRVALAIAIAVAVVVGAIVERQIRVGGRYSERSMVVLAMSVLPAGMLGMLYWGLFSGAQLFPVMALYFFSRRERFRSALMVWAANAAAQAVFAIIVIGGVIEDPGLFRPDLPRGVLIVGHLLIQIGGVGAFLLGTRSHRAARTAIEKMERAMVLAAQRDALLQEARQDLERLRVGGPGRYSEQTFGGFKLGNVIGRGGMGEVYEATSVDGGALAAVKLLALRELGNPKSVERFVREVRAISKLDSPHVVRVLDASKEGDPIPYLVMERLRGADLAQLLRDGQAPPGELDELLGQVGAALEEAWRQGVVHRDLKPQNLFRAETAAGPIWKVLDFGVAALNEHAGTLTHGHIVGTPAYMAPEQARGERVDHRADLYALAAIAYRWLTGQPVYSGRDLHASLYQVVHVMPAQPSALAPLHHDVDAALALGLAKDPAARYQRAEELRAALSDARSGQLDGALRRRAAELLTRTPWSGKPE